MLYFYKTTEDFEGAIFFSTASVLNPVFYSGLWVMVFSSGFLFETTRSNMKLEDLIITIQYFKCLVAFKHQFLMKK